VKMQNLVSEICHCAGVAPNLGDGVHEEASGAFEKKYELLYDNQKLHDERAAENEARQTVSCVK